MDNENDMIENEHESNDDQVDRIFHVLLDAIPNNVCYFNVLVALAHLAEEITIVLHEENHEMSDGDDEDDDDDDDGDISPIGRLPKISFSQN